MKEASTIKEEVITFATTREFGRYAANHPEVYDSVSPGAACALMDLSRTHVHHLIKTGKLRAWIIRSPLCERSNYVFIHEESIHRFLANRPKRGPAPRSIAA